MSKCSAHKEKMAGSALALLMVLGLAGCGSGGGGAEPPASPPPRPDPLSFPDEPGLTAEQEMNRAAFAESSEFENQWSLAEIGADYAYARGYTGEGVIVGMIDSGADPNHSALSGQLHALSAVVSGSCPNGVCPFGPTRDPHYHGTSVGSVISGKRQDGIMHGVAYESELLSIGIPLDTPPDYYQPVDLSDPTVFIELDERMQGVYARIGDTTRIINHSFNFHGVVTDYTDAEYRAAFGRTVDSLVQAGTPDSEKIIMVWAAGNSYGSFDAEGNEADASSPDVAAGTPNLFPELRGHFISVVATDETGAIAGYSNRCGVASDYCIAAPGEAVVAAAGSTDQYFVGSGTSLAAPQVSGALALMEEAFRGQLGSTEMVSRLFAAADKSGIYADEEIYGQGILDVEKATRPLGMMRTSLGQNLNGPAGPASGAIAAGGAWGDALQRGLAGLEMAVFDSLNAPFFVPMEHLNTAWPLDGHWRMEQLYGRFVDRALGSGSHRTAIVGGWTLSSAHGLAAAPSANSRPRRSIDRIAGIQNAWVALGTDGLGIARDLFSAGEGSRVRSGFIAQNSGVARGQRLTVPGRAQGAFLNLEVVSEGHRVLAELGVLRESERLLGAGAEGAYGQLAGSTFFTRFFAERELGGELRLWAAAQRGYTSAKANHGLLRSAQHVQSSAYSAGVYWDGKPSSNARRLWLMFSQPLRNESGALMLNYPTGRTRAGGVLRRTELLDSEPSGRQFDLALGFETALRLGASGPPAWRLHTEVWHSRQPGHRADARPENTLFLALSRSF